MKNLRDIFDCWGSVADMAADVGEGHWAVAKWRQRKKIPSSAWPALLKALKRKGKDVSASDLLAMHARKSKSSSVSQPYNGGNAA